jgi:hypothetical protein
MFKIRNGNIEMIQAVFGDASADGPEGTSWDGGVQ